MTRVGGLSGTFLCADDYAISDGVSRGIEELAAARRLSGTSAIVTLPSWRRYGRRLARLRPQIAIGLHVNLTLAAPLGPMPRLAPSGRFPTLSRLSSLSLSGRIDRSEVAAEVGRQLAAFAAATGFEPEFIDGHQHAHALPGVRAGLLRALMERFEDADVRPFVRDPADSMRGIAKRGACVGKSLTINVLSTGFRDLVRGAGFVTNDTFSGVSSFSTRRSFARELDRFMRHAGDFHIVMCHPGHPDAELAALDPVGARRGQELEALMGYPGLRELIWHPERVGLPPEAVPDPGEGR